MRNEQIYKSKDDAMSALRKSFGLDNRTSSERRNFLEALKRIVVYEYGYQPMSDYQIFLYLSKVICSVTYQEDNDIKELTFVDVLNDYYNRNDTFEDYKNWNIKDLQLDDNSKHLYTRMAIISLVFTYYVDKGYPHDTYKYLCKIYSSYKKTMSNISSVSSLDIRRRLELFTVNAAATIESGDSKKTNMSSIRKVKDLLLLLNIEERDEFMANNSIKKYFNICNKYLSKNNSREVDYITNAFSYYNNRHGYDEDSILDVMESSPLIFEEVIRNRWFDGVKKFSDEQVSRFKDIAVAYLSSKYTNSSSSGLEHNINYITTFIERFKMPIDILDIVSELPDKIQSMALAVQLGD